MLFSVECALEPESKATKIIFSFLTGSGVGLGFSVLSIWAITYFSTFDIESNFFMLVLPYLLSLCGLISVRAMDEQKIHPPFWIGLALSCIWSGWILFDAKQITIKQGPVFVCTAACEILLDVFFSVIAIFTLCFGSNHDKEEHGGESISKTPQKDQTPPDKKRRFSDRFSPMSESSPVKKEVSEEKKSPDSPFLFLGFGQKS